MSGFSFTNSHNYTNLSCDYFKNTENMCLFILWIKALFGLMEEEVKKEEERNDFPLFGQKRKQKGGRMGGKKVFVEFIIFSLKITLVPSKGLVYFCKMTFISHIFPFCFSSYPNTHTQERKYFLSPTLFFFFLPFLFSFLPFH